MGNGFKRYVRVVVSGFFATVLVIVAPGAAVAEPGTLYLASTTSDGEKGNAGSWDPEMVDGTKVLFVSGATNLDPRDSDDYPDVYLKDLVSGTVELVSVRPDGVKGNYSALAPAISEDSTKVVFRSGATNLDPADTDPQWDIYLKDLVSGQLSLVSTNSDGVKANGYVGDHSLSGDGTKMVFGSSATNLTPEETSDDIDLFMKDLVTGEVRLVSTDAEGTKAYGSFFPAEVSTDGSRLVFTTTARLDARDEDTLWDVYVKDLTSGAVFLADTTREGEKANYGGAHGAISGDGTKAAFTTTSTNLDPEDTDRNDDYDIYVKDLQTGELTLVSKGTSNYPKLSYDGMRVAFSSMATDLHPSDTEYYNDVYVTDLRTGSVMLASTTTEGGNVMPGDAVVGAISADGTRVAFHVDRGGFLDPRDTDSSPDVYVKDLGPTPPPENRPPDCSSVVVSPGVISPPARPRFTLVTLDGATDEDGDDLGYSITGVTQDEPVLAVGDVTTPDARMTSGDGVELRAEFNPRGDGRIYRLAFEVSDGKGGACTGAVTVAVSRGGRAAVDSGTTYNSFG